MNDSLQTTLEQEIEMLDKEIDLLRRRVKAIRNVRQLCRRDEAPRLTRLGEAREVVVMTTAEMIERVEENAGRPLTAEEIRQHVRRDFGMLPEDLAGVIQKCKRPYGQSARRRPANERFR